MISPNEALAIFAILAILATILAAIICRTPRVSRGRVIGKKFEARYTYINGSGDTVNVPEAFKIKLEIGGGAVVWKEVNEFTYHGLRFGQLYHWTEGVVKNAE